MNMNQVAFAYTTDKERDHIKSLLGLRDAPWVHDVVTADIMHRVVPGLPMEHGTNVSELQFCMAMGGQQFELIRAVEGPSWISHAIKRSLELRTPFIAHIGFHMEEGEPWPPIAADGSLRILQEARTTSHRNEELNRIGRRYHYRICEVAPLSFVKYIRRLTVD